MSGILKISETIPPVPPPVEFWKPSDFLNWTPPEDYVIAGDNHIVRGGLTMIGGPPGVGKTRVLTALAMAGATGADWLGVPIRCQFRTLIVQAENGPCRVKDELAHLRVPEDIDLDDWLRITPPPQYGLNFGDDEFREIVRRQVEQFEPAIVAIDPWNRVAQDDNIKDYRKALELIHSVLPADPGKRPAQVINCHLRKRKGDSKKRGRDLLEELAGSHFVGSAARTVYVLEPASPDQEDDRVVWTCAKCNDGIAGAPTAWHRESHGFTPCPEFDLDEYLSGGETERRRISENDVRDAIGAGGVRRAQVVSRMKSAGWAPSTAYAALKTFEDLITEDTKGELWWTNGTE